MSAPVYRLDERLKEYGTATQRKYLDAVNEHRSIRAAARAVGVNFSTVHDSIECLKKKAALCGFAPQAGMTHPVPSPFVVSGVSTLYDEEGQQRAQWVKTRADHFKAEEVLREFVVHLVEDAKGRSKLVTPPKLANEDLLAVYPIGDPHFGMYAWKAEAGKDFDTEIAERLTVGAVDRLVSSAPPAETAILLPLGDVMHADDTKNRTPQSGNALDVDTRHQRVMVIALKAIKHAIYRLLEKHKTVIVRVVKGNHDPHSSFAIALALSEYFSNNQRVTIDLSPSAFWFYRFGQVLIGATHGDTAKGRDLLGVMAADKPQEWGQTKFRYFYHGHEHQEGKQEFPGLLVEKFRTLAPADAWSAGEGYRAGRNMNCIVHSKAHGEIERHTCDISMIEAA